MACVRLAQRYGCNVELLLLLLHTPKPSLSCRAVLGFKVGKKKKVCVHLNQSGNMKQSGTKTVYKIFLEERRIMLEMKERE
jgi:hypothetical protein